MIASIKHALRVVIAAYMHFVSGWLSLSVHLAIVATVVKFHFCLIADSQGKYYSCSN